MKVRVSVRVRVNVGARVAVRLGMRLRTRVRLRSAAATAERKVLAAASHAKQTRTLAPGDVVTVRGYGEGGKT